MRIETSAGIQTRLLTLSRGFYSSDDPTLHFGLGNLKKVDRLTIDWPSGIVQQLTNLNGGQLHTITEAKTSNAKPYRERRAEGKEPLYTKSDKLDHLAHTELAFDDYERQPLLPAKHSQLGPGHAWGDIDGDGDDDLFLGGPKGAASRLYLRDKEQFVNAPFDKDATSEDMAPIFFDANGDGDLDLYVVSGGVECEPGGAVLQDRLYFNDGKGSFRKTPNALPKFKQSGSVVCAADYDHDGDVDLFVGGRVVPGRYPDSPLSQLLENDGNGTFTDITPSAIREIGLVTSALWSDVNDDGWVDLLVTQEWGPVILYANTKGELGQAIPISGSGWWNSIAGTDIDGDGDIDYALGNFGLNTKYHASTEHPTLLYYGDMENTGRPHIIEAEFEDAVLYPMRGRSCSSGAMPTLAKRFPTFKSFAAASLAKIYDGNRLAQSQKLQATTLESGILVNVTEGGVQAFKWNPLPRTAQIAPVFGLSFTEINGDGFPDLVLAQNFHGPQRETGHMDGGVGLVLLGDGQTNFTPVWPDKSGIAVSGDATSLSINDINSDGLPDLFIGINAAKPASYEHSKTTTNQTLCIRLPSTSLPGTRVTVHLKAGTQQTSETHIGGGYLSQSAPLLFFGLRDGGTKAVKEIAVKFPNQKEIRRALYQLKNHGRIYHFNS